MCGITGAFHTTPVDFGDEPANLTNLARRRGPDDEGIWHTARRVWLGFTRLAILDLSHAGHQPMSSADGRHVIVFNGEIYNFRDLRRELEGIGHRFRSTSDSEVVVEALARWGARILQRLDGMFAIAWYDVEARRLTLARDPVGIKPLYYMRSPGGVVFGSQYDQLMRHPFARGGEVDTRALRLFLQFGHVPAPLGLLSNTHLLQPGHLLTIDDGHAGAPCPFRVFDAGPTRMGGDDAVERVEVAIDSAVRRQLVADVPIGVFLSGGVDSPLVAASAARQSATPLTAFTIGTTDPRMDEADAATEFGRALNIEHRIRHFDDGTLLDMVGDVAKAFSEPFADFSAFPTMLVSRMAREEVTAILSGDGGDELFWGYPRVSRMLRSRELFERTRLERTVRYAAGRLGLRGRQLAGIRHGSMVDWFVDAHSTLGPEDLSRIAPGSDGEHPPLLDREPDLSSSDALAQWLRREEFHGHLQMVLLKVDRASMYHSLEVRVPLLDPAVIDAAYSLDHRICVDDHQGKLVLRRALARAYPTIDPNQRKRGFTIPMSKWLATALRPMVEDLLLDQDPWPNGFFDRKELRALYDRHLAGIGNRPRGLWGLLALQLWNEHHLAPARLGAVGPA